MNELVFKGQNDQVLTNSLFAETIESSRNEDGSLTITRRTVASKKMVDLMVGINGLLSGEPYFETLLVTDDELKVLSDMYYGKLFDDTSNEVFIKEMSNIVSKYPKNFFAEADVDIIKRISYRAAYTISGKSLWTLRDGSDIFKITEYLKSIINEEYIDILIQECELLKFISNNICTIHLVIHLFNQINSRLNPICKEIQYTYLIFDGRLFKIGKSQNPINRIKQLTTGNPLIELIHIINRDVETLLHHKFANKRVFGEWFDLSQSDIDYIKSL